MLSLTRRPLGGPHRWTRFAGTIATAAAVGLLSAHPIAQKDKDKDKDADKGKRASLVLKASPSVSFSPSRIFVSAELRGGTDLDADLYCPEVQWDWGDGTVSEANEDCAPFEAGKSTIKRRWSSVHTFTTGGNYRVILRLRRNDRTVAAGSQTVEVRPGVRDMTDGVQ